MCGQTEKRKLTPTQIANKIHAILKRLDNDEIQLHFDGYAEPGYTEPQSGIIALANWNDYEGVGRAFEAMGIECEWYDKWSSCGECGKLVRTEPDCYAWLPSYAILNECEIYCHDCIKADPTAYLEELEGNERRADVLGIDLEEHGYRLYESEFESGFHPGQNDEPADIAKKLKEKGLTKFIFVVDSKGQFDVGFSVWVKDSEDDREEGREDEDDMT